MKNKRQYYFLGALVVVIVIAVVFGSTGLFKGMLTKTAKERPSASSVSLPDLTVLDYKFSIQPRGRSQTVTLNVTVKNIGSANVTAPFWVWVSPSDGEGTRQINGLNVDETKTVEFTHYRTPETANTKIKYTIVVDSSRAIAESKDTDAENTFITYPYPTKSNLKISSYYFNLASPDNLILTVKVNNAGPDAIVDRSFPVWVCEAPCAEGKYNGYSFIYNLGVGESKSLDFSINFTGDEGRNSHKYQIFVDSARQIEDDDADNKKTVQWDPPPLPDIVLNGYTVNDTLKRTGKRFVELRAVIGNDSSTAITKKFIVRAHTFNSKLTREYKKTVYSLGAKQTIEVVFDTIETDVKEPFSHNIYADWTGEIQEANESNNNL